MGGQAFAVQAKQAGGRPNPLEGVSGPDRDAKPGRLQAKAAGGWVTAERVGWAVWSIGVGFSTP